MKARGRVLSDKELPLFWSAFKSAGLAGLALQLILLTGQRPGEVVHMRHEHIIDGWWEMPGTPIATLGWPGTKNGEDHRVWLPAPVQTLLSEIDGDEGFVLAGARGQTMHNTLDRVMRAICADLGVSNKVTPHDLRRTHGTRITGLGFGRDAMNRIQNHKEGGIGEVYDRYSYAKENKQIMEAVAADIMGIVEGNPAGNVVQASFGR
jgi:integrase